MKLLRCGNKLARVGGRLARDTPACRAIVCKAQGYFLAVRCNPDPSVPNVPDRILFVNTFRCSPGADPFFGVVTYRGYCYQVAGGTDHRPEDFPGVPIAAPAEIVCKPPGVTCEDTECLPPGECCITAMAGCSGNGGPACKPCNCPTFASYELRFQWSTSATVFDLSGGRQTRVQSGNGRVFYQCVQGSGNGTRSIVAGSETYTCATVQPFAQCPPCQAFANYSGPLRVLASSGNLNLRFGEIPGTLIQAQAVIQCVLGAGGCQACHTLPNSLGQCSCNRAVPGCLSADQSTMAADCFGGSWQWSGTGVGDFVPPFQWYTGAGSFSWQWVPLSTCDTPQPLLEGEPPRKVAKVNRLTFRQIIDEIRRMGRP